MLKRAAILYAICLLCFTIFSRQPDYFDGAFIKGIIVNGATGNKEAHFIADDLTYKIAIVHWEASSFVEGQQVNVIFNPSQPSQAAVYTLFSYWISLPGLIISAFGFLVLFFIAIFITGKETPYFYPEEEKRKKRKYDDHS